MLEHAASQKNPFESPESRQTPFYVLLETQEANESETFEEAIMSLLEDPQSGVVDGIVAESPSHMEALWGLREGIPEACARSGKVYKYDVSVKISDMYALVEETREKLSQVENVMQVVGFGHVGDGNLHLNVLCKAFSDATEAALEPSIFKRLKELGGSISAEHGIGQAKAEFLRYSRDEAEIETMRRIKRALDPNGILNPGKVLE